MKQASFDDHEPGQDQPEEFLTEQEAGSDSGDAGEELPVEEAISSDAFIPDDELLGHITLRRMNTDDLTQVVSIESAVYTHPWTYGNFIDSLCNGYDCWVACLPYDTVCGYFLLMPVVDEAHLLNLSVHNDVHGKGIGRLLLDTACAQARAQQMISVLLEVRPSNERAVAIYQRYGFEQIGVRRGYYPVDAQTREDALVLRYAL